MPWNKTDRAFKALMHKRVTDSDGKFFFNEKSDVTLHVHLDDVWADTVPSTPPGATTSVVAVYNTLVLIEDLSVPDQACWFATSNGTTVSAQTDEASRLKDWIPERYGDDYGVVLYDKDDVQIPPSDGCGWYFDYATGILTFASTTTTTGPGGTLASRSTGSGFKIKAYRYVGRKGVDGMLDFKESVRAATTAALTVTYSNGTSGVGATLTNAGTQAAFALDSVTLAAGERVLIKNQASALQNGIYTVTTVGSGSSNWVLTRAEDADTGVELNGGAFVFVEEGSTYADTGWVCTTDGTVTMGTTAINWTQFSGVGSWTAGVGLNQSGTTIAANVQLDNSVADRIRFVGGSGSNNSASALTAGTSIALNVVRDSGAPSGQTLTLTALSTGYTLSGGNTATTLTLSGSLTVSTAGTLSLNSQSLTLTGSTANVTLTPQGTTATQYNLVSSATNQWMLSWGGATWTPSQGSLFYSGASYGALTAVSGTSTQVLIGGTAPAFGAVNLTTMVTGILPLVNGGTNANLTAVNGGIVWSNASAFAISAAGVSGQVLTSGGAGAPTWTDQGALSVRWNSIANPNGNQSLTMSTNTTVFNWATGTSTNNLFSFTTDASANGTGALVNIATGASSTVLPLLVKAGSTTALTVNASGGVLVGSLTSGRVTYAGTSGLLQDSANMTFDGNRLSLATTGNTGGLLIGGDANLYRSAADVLKTDDSLVVGTNLEVAGGTVTLYTATEVNAIVHTTLHPSSSQMVHQMRSNVTNSLTTFRVRGNGSNTVQTSFEFLCNDHATDFARLLFVGHNDSTGVVLAMDSGGAVTGKPMRFRAGTGGWDTLPDIFVLDLGVAKFPNATGTSTAILVGGDANLYRSAADVLKTDDSLVVAVNLTVNSLTSGRVPFASTSGLLVDSANFTYTTGSGRLALATTGSGAGILIGGDTQLYRTSADVLRTPDTLQVDTLLGVGGTAAARIHGQGNLTAAAWTTNGIGLRLDAATFTDSSSSGTVAAVAGYALGRPTLAASSSTTYTDAAALYISNSPANGANVTITNAWSLWVDAGNVRFDGSVHIRDTGASGNGLYIYDSDSTQKIKIQAPATGSLTSDYTLTLPVDDGTPNQFLQTDGSGNLTWATASGGGMTWTEVTGTSQTMSVNNGYIANNASLVTLTIPTTAAVGDVIEVVGKGAGGWRIAQGASQQIHFGNVSNTSGSGGQINSTHQRDSLRMVCITANTTWQVVSAVGNVDLV